MKPKKRDKEREVTQEPQYESIQADRELFLQAFEKPTQIYRYLRSRNIVSPIFLHRTLYYMKHKRSIGNKKRKFFKVDSILSKVEAKHKRESLTNSYKSQYLNLSFTGFLDRQGYPGYDTAGVEAILFKNCHKKRKDVSSTVLQTSLGKVSVPVNPSSPATVDTSFHTISVPHSNFNHTNGHSVRSYVLLLSVTYPEQKPIPNGLCNGDILDAGEPPQKKRRNGKTFPYDDDLVVYGSELVIFDRHGRCLLTDGEYDLALKELGSKSPPKKQTTWETVVDVKPVGPFETFSRCPTLKFKLSWTDVENTPENGFKQEDMSGFPDPLNGSNHVIYPENSGSKCNSPVKLKEENQTTPKKKTRIFYQFLYNNNTRQQTEAKDDLHCPWCSFNCMQLYSLLKHLRMCHARFNFIYVPHHKGARIDVSINERYDGSYAGNPQDLHSHIGYAFSRNGPVRRTPVTYVIVYRPKFQEPSLSEFMVPETDNQISRQFIQGHNRLYFHLVTCQPIQPQGIDDDSEDENDPLWLRQKTVQMIDEFSDVNEGEKELMKLWNLHIMKRNYIADCQLPKACSTFVEESGRQIVEKNLCQNFLLHLVNLFDFSLIRPEVVQKTYCELEVLRQEMGVE